MEPLMIRLLDVSLFEAFKRLFVSRITWKLTESPWSRRAVELNRL